MKLIDNWRKLWWRRWSTWLAALNAILVAHVFSQPILVVGLLGFAPGPWMLPIAIVAALLAFGLPVLVAQIKQPKLEQMREDEDRKAALTGMQTDG